MRRITMMLALLVALLVSSASETGVAAMPARPLLLAPPWVRPATVCPTEESAKALGYAIADHPRPPLGWFKLTAYSGPQLGQARPITATGASAKAGLTVAVDPKVIPLGSRIYIEGIGERIAEDVGSGVKGHHIDVYVKTVPGARQFGVQRGTVTMIELPPSGDS